MVTLSQALIYYKRPEIQKAIAEHAQDKEISGSFDMKGYSRRPDIIMYPNEVLELVKRGITSFHCSEELWRDPLKISSKLKPEEMNEIKKGWDLILDIDCKELEFSKLAAHYLIQALKYHDIKSVYCKFSGNHGFHIGVPFEALPKTVNGQEVRLLFPEAPRRIAEYLKEMIEPHLRKALLQKNTPEKISLLSGESIEKILVNNVLQPFSFLEIDTILISSRHLYRMPYSFNEKSGLISVPIKFEQVLNFDKQSAKPENVKVTGIPFLERNIEPNQASKLFIQAYDFTPKIKEEELLQKVEQIQGINNNKREFEDIQTVTPENLFPPCIYNIVQGLEDGKKRAIFILINFLSNVGWPYQKIEQFLYDWNKKNNEPLREVYLRGQLNSFNLRKNKILPPNCSNESYYKGLNICKSDNLCKKIKNPVNYTRRKVFAVQNAEKIQSSGNNLKGRPKLTEEQKAMRKVFRERKKVEKEQIDIT